MRAVLAPLMGPVALTVAAMMTTLAGCGVGGKSAHHDVPVLLAQSQGLCPPHVVYVRMPDACRFAHQWNGATPMFTTPRRLWGVAYAFNCGSQARTFSFDEWLPAMDHMIVGGVYRHARTGSGYIMIPKQTMIDLLNAVPREFKGDGAFMKVEIASECTWHVKAMLGSRRDVAASVPPVPAMESPWWKKTS
jgi:hypothetical protein